MAGTFRLSPGFGWSDIEQALNSTSCRYLHSNAATTIAVVVTRDHTVSDTTAAGCVRLSCPVFFLSTLLTTRNALNCSMDLPQTSGPQLQTMSRLRWTRESFQVRSLNQPRSQGLFGFGVWKGPGNEVESQFLCLFVCLFVFFFLLESYDCFAVKCGRRPGSRIVGGEEAPVNAWPWQVMLRREAGSQFCGASLVTDTWVVTAAHCVRGMSTNSFYVRCATFGSVKRKFASLSSLLRKSDCPMMCTSRTSLTLSLPSSKSTFPQPSKDKRISEVVSIGSIIIFHLSEL